MRNTRSKHMLSLLSIQNFLNFKPATDTFVINNDENTDISSGKLIQHLWFTKVNYFS